MTLLRRRARRWLALGLLLGPVSTVATAAPAGAWDQLSSADRTWVRDQLKQQLPQMFDGDRRVYTQYFVDNVEVWSRFAGDVSEGNWRAAGQVLADKGAAQLSKRLDGMLPPDGVSRTLFGMVQRHPDAAKRVGGALLDPERGVGDAVDIVWSEARKELSAVVAARTTGYVRDTINWVAGDRSVQGYTAGDVYLVLLRTWTEIVGAEARRFERDTENTLFRLYAEARGRGSIASAREELVDIIIAGRYPRDGLGAGSTRTFTSGLIAAGVEREQLLDLFERFYDERESEWRDFHGWLEDRANAAVDARAKEARNRARAELAERKRILAEEVAWAHRVAAERLRTLVEQRLTEEQKDARRAAVARIQPLVDTLALTAERIRLTCHEYRRSRTRALAVLDGYQGVPTSSVLLEMAADRVLARRAALAEAETLAAEAADVFAADTTIDESLATASEQAGAACRASRAVAQSADRATGRPHLDDAIAAAGRVESAVSRGEEAAATLRARIDGFAERVEDVTARVGRTDLERLRTDLNELRAGLEARDRHAEAQTRFAEHKSAMGRAIETGRALVRSLKEKRRLIEAALGGHNPDDAILAAWRSLAAAEAELSCVEANAFDWEFGPEPGSDAYGGKAWRDRELPWFVAMDPGVEARAREALAAGEAMSRVPESFGTIASRARFAERQLDGHESRLRDHAAEADLCLAAAIQDYADLPGDAVVTDDPDRDPGGWTGPDDPTDGQRPDRVAYLIEVSGAGWSFHWAGGSYVFKGSNEEILWVARDQDPERIITEYQRRLDADPCEVDIPAFPGMVKRPQVWNSGPRVAKVRGPIIDPDELRDLTLKNTWRKLTSDGPYIGEIRERAGCD